MKWHNLGDLLGKIWEQEEIPTEWKEGYLVKLPKKGDMQDCNNYKGIMLLSVTRKGPQQSHLGQTEDRGGCQAQRPPNWLP